jgi:hypothetical protein
MDAHDTPPAGAETGLAQIVYRLGELAPRRPAAKVPPGEHYLRRVNDAVPSDRRELALPREAETEGLSIRNGFGVCSCSQLTVLTGFCLTPSFPALCQYSRTQHEERDRAGFQELTQQNKEDIQMSKNHETFNAQIEVEQIRARRTEARRKLYRKSRLDKYRAELVAMKQAPKRMSAEQLRQNLWSDVSQDIARQPMSDRKRSSGVPPLTTSTLDYVRRGQDLVC